MSGRVAWIDCEASRPGADIDSSSQHPSRLAVARLLDGDGAAAHDLRAIYEAQAPTWQKWSGAQRDYLDALRRGLHHAPAATGTWLEICSGTGEATATVLAHAPSLVAMDGSFAMISQSSHAHIRMVSDVGALALRSGAVAAVVGLNAVPLVKDVPRVLRPDGWLLLAYSFAEHTPLYAVPEDVLSQLGPSWAAECSRGPWGEFQFFARR